MLGMHCSPSFWNTASSLRTITTYMCIGLQLLIFNDKNFCFLSLPLSKAAAPASCMEALPHSHGSLSSRHPASIAFLEYHSSCPVLLPSKSSMSFKPLPCIFISSLLGLRKLNDLTSHSVIILSPPGDNYIVIVLYGYLILIWFCLTFH